MNLVLLAIVLVLITFAVPAVTFAPWVPTKAKDFKTILDALQLNASDVFVDLGCGAGGLTLVAAERCRAIGIEQSPVMFLISWVRGKVRGSPAQFRLGDFRRAKLDDVTVAYLFGTPSGLSPAMRDFLARAFQPETKIVSYVFEIKDWKPERMVKLPSGISLFVYRTDHPLPPPS